MAEIQTYFKSYHSTINHLVTHRIIMEETCNEKTNFLVTLWTLEKYLYTLLKSNIWTKLEELKVSFELRATTIRLYENILAKCKKIEGRSEDINCNLGVKKGYPMSPTLFNIFINKIQGFFEEAGCIDTTLSRIIVILIIYLLSDIFIWQDVPLIMTRN